MVFFGVPIHPVTYPLSKEMEVMLKVAAVYVFSAVVGYVIPIVRDTLRCMDYV